MLGDQTGKGVDVLKAQKLVAGRGIPSCKWSLFIFQDGILLIKDKFSKRYMKL